MRQHMTKHTRKAGLPPGTVVYTGDKRFENVRASLVRFSADDYSEEDIRDFGSVPPAGNGRTTWITVNGVHQPEKIETLCARFGIHHLAVEDICNTSQRPKVVDYDDHYFVVINDFRLAGEGVLHYFKDLYDHVMQIIEMIEGYGEIIVGMFEIYASGMSIKMNNIMKILTTIATIFIPLTFLAGVYGMNFRYMPGLTWEYGYYAIVVVMVTIAIAMLIYFRKKKWL